MSEWIKISEDVDGGPLPKDKQLCYFFNASKEDKILIGEFSTWELFKFSVYLTAPDCPYHISDWTHWAPVIYPDYPEPENE